MPELQQYRALASYYDAIYHWKDYAKESGVVREILTAQGVLPGARLVEAACGTGSHLVHLRGEFDVRGFDRSQEMLAAARPKLPGIELWCADMADFSVEPCDVLLCLFSSIGYLLTLTELEAAAACFARALKPGGTLLVEPWLTREAWDPGRPMLQTYESPDLKLARAVVTGIEGEIAVMEMNWLVVERDQPVRHVVSRHEMWLCPLEVLEATFEGAGFEVSWSDQLGARGLLVGRLRA